ncbi:MAG: helix-turn-helix domain-containing protein [Caulobacter sp.]
MQIMSLQDLDVIVRVAGATLALAGVFLLNRDGHRRLALAFLPLALGLAGFLAGNTPETALRLGGMAGYVGKFLAGWAAVFLWWFCLAVFDRGFRPRGAVLATGLAWIAIAGADRGLFGPALEDLGLSWILITLGFGMVAHLAWRVIRDREGDLLDRRRRARMMVVVLLGGQLLADLTVDVVLGMDWQPHAFSILQNAGFLLFTCWLVWVGFEADEPQPLLQTKPEACADTAEDTRLKNRLGFLIDVDRLHLDPQLTFDDFVRQMGAPERTVRRLINHQLGHDHFRSFLNTQRVNEARRLLADPGRRNDKLIAIALDSGFSSLASFNRVFRDVAHTTPSDFRARAGF